MVNGKLQKVLKLTEKIGIPRDVNIESPLVSLSLRHFKYDLNSTTAPLIWDITSENQNKTIKVKITIDKRAMDEDTEIEEYVLKSIKNNESFSDLVHALQQFEPHNKRIKNLYNVATWKKTETNNQLIYSKTINFGEYEDNE